MMHCNNEGCEWTGKLGKFEHHLAKQCTQMFIDCTNRCKDLKGIIVQILRKNEKVHLVTECPNRVVECELCNESGQHHSITGPCHLNECPKVIVECPNDCSLRMAREDLEDHYDNCPNEEIECTYEDIGCQVELPRKNMPEHEHDTALHLQLAIMEIRALKVKKDSEIKIFTFKISNFAPMFMVYGPPFFTSPGGYKMCVRISSKEGYLSVFLYLMQGENDDILPWPFRPAIFKITLLNQKQDEGHISHLIQYSNIKDSTSNQRVTDQERSTSGQGKSKFITLDALKEPFLVNNTLYFKVTVVKAPTPQPWLVCD